MNIRPVEPRDREAWLRLREALWPDDDDLAEGVAAYFTVANPDAITLVAESKDHQLIGFAEVEPRAYAEGCETSPVAFLEGWYVNPDARASGVGRALVQAAESWARGRGFSELGSDTELNNQASIQAHLALGFAETERLVCFLKRL